MAEEVGVAFVRLVPSMRGFGPEASRQMNDAAAGPAAAAGEEAGSRFGGAFQTAMLGAGLLAGVALVGGITEALDQGQITARMGAQLGATAEDAKRFGQVAGQLLGQGVTTNFQQAADAVRGTMAAGLLPPEATNAQIESVATKVADLASTFELDLGETATAVGQLIKNGMAPDAKAGLDLLAKGFSGTDKRAGDLLETVTEYGAIFKTAGVSGATAMGLVRQGLQAGAKDTDKIADALKEFSLKAVTDAKPVQDAFAAIGVNGKEIGAGVAAGGSRAEDAIGKVLDALREMPATTARATAIQDLFGGPGEDLGASIFALDVDKARASMDGAAGAAATLGDSLRDNAGAQLTAFTRGLQQGLVEVLGGTVVPALVSAGKGFQTYFLPPLKEIGSAIGSYVMPPLRTFGSWLKDNPAAIRFIGGFIIGFLVPAMILMGVAAMVSAARVVAGWVVTGATAIGSAATQVAAGASVVAGWVLMGVQSMIQAARMAAAWFIALGPIGWVIAAIIAVAAIIFLNWDKIKKFTAEAWEWVWGKIKGFGQLILGYIQNIPLVKWFLQHWDRIKTGTAQKVLGFIAWVRGIPGRITGAIGNLGSLLYTKGRDIVLGLWNGIKAMGSWLKGQLMSFARNMIPGPIAKALGIGSPSKVMAQEIGRWIPAGIQQGIEAHVGDVSASTQLAAAAALPGHAGMSASGTAAATGTTVIIDGTAMPRALLEWLRGAVRTDGQGSVQTLLGQPGRA